MKYVEVILPLPLEGTFTYGVPEPLEARVQPGVRVLVPLGKSKTYVGVCDSRALELSETKSAGKQADGGKKVEYKNILSVLDDTPVLLPQQLKLWHWIADYYMSPIGDVYKAALPSGLKAEEGFKPKTETYVCLSRKFRTEQSLHIALDCLRRAVKQQEVLMAYLQLSGIAENPVALTIDAENPDDGEPSELNAVTQEELMNAAHCTMVVLRGLLDKQILVTYKKEVGRLNNDGNAHRDTIKPLNEAQTEAYNQILLQMLGQKVTLLHGVTSSGKTEIYIHLIQKMLDEHKQVLYLLPEIALTVQIMDRLKRVFGNRLGIYHSKYSDAERVEIWNKQLSSHPYDVILGARSAVFLPFQNLGLVIIDEEHETSFKQQDPAPRYHARSAAIVLAQMYGARTLLGTATPSMESYYNAQQGKYGFVRLDRRYKDIQLPEIEVVDVKDLQRRKMMAGPFSPRLLSVVREALTNGEQAILFQNRRGFAPMVECNTCGWMPKCPNCDVSLTHHKNMGLLSCHYCGYTYRVPEACPNCESRDIRNRGYGTEKIEDEIINIFPEARVSRMDLDTTRTKNAYERLITEFSEGKTNLLIGTQMISKGLDFDKVSVVGILNADSMLNYPDFRSYEQAFMMMSQVSGRAGRKGKRGLVILQTKNHDLPVIQQVVHNDYEGFYRSLLEERKDFRYPPFYHLVYVYLKHRDGDTVNSASLEMGSRLREIFGNRVLGPDKPAIARVKTLHIRKIILKLENGIDYKLVKTYLRQVQEAMMKEKRYGALMTYYDVDPL
ncbi:primosomal protein N' [Prevotella sp. HUN102]|uniref:replication restart helicase PriA n=1 Tax=Prevotella sp. HUN102 TaxID=1392486 RepID=UPI00048F08B7|nr:primosomal protein N' [Prevotella sp. HUN102]